MRVRRRGGRQCRRLRMGKERIMPEVLGEEEWEGVVDGVVEK